MRTVRELLERALKKIQVYDVGETTDPEDINNALEVFQDLIAEFSGGLIVPQTVTEYFSMVASQSSYTIGESGSPDKNTQRPEKIIDAFVRSSNYDYPVVIIDIESYNSIVSKSSTASRPEYLHYNPTTPNGTIYLYPTPSSTDSLYITSIKSLSEPTSLTEDVLDDVEIPRNYHNPLAWLIAIELCPEYGKVVTPIMANKAERAISELMALNLARSIKPATIELAHQRLGRPNILSGS